ncbi:MAG: DNA-binding IscR family transcriptional regulator [bacterium]
MIEAIEGPMTFSVCSRDNHEYECIVTVECPAKNAMQVIHARINNYIQYLNLEELALLKPDDEKKTELGNENKCNCFSKDPNTETVQKTS